MECISRKAAKAAGLKYYFTGKPCKRGGHIDKRFVSSFSCMTCSREKAKEDWDNSDPEWHRKRTAYNQSRWHHDHQFRARMQAYKSHPDELRKQRERNREWKKANRASCTDRQSKRNALLREVFVEDVSLAEIFERDNGRCKICGFELSMDTKWPHPRTPTRDHVVPLSKGGKHERSNLQLACAECNIRKGDRCA
jgi:Restriction endonuclease